MLCSLVHTERIQFTFVCQDRLCFAGVTDNRKTSIANNNKSVFLSHYCVYHKSVATWLHVAPFIWNFADSHTEGKENSQTTPWLLKLLPGSDISHFCSYFVSPNIKRSYLC